MKNIDISFPPISYGSFPHKYLHKNIASSSLCCFNAKLPKSLDYFLQNFQRSVWGYDLFPRVRESGEGNLKGGGGEGNRG